MRKMRKKSKGIKTGPRPVKTNMANKNMRELARAMTMTRRVGSLIVREQRRQQRGK